MTNTTDHSVQQSGAPAGVWAGYGYPATQQMPAQQMPAQQYGESQYPAAQYPAPQYTAPQNNWAPADETQAWGAPQTWGLHPKPAPGTVSSKTKLTIGAAAVAVVAAVLGGYLLLRPAQVAPLAANPLAPVSVPAHVPAINPPALNTPAVNVPSINTPAVNAPTQPLQPTLPNNPPVVPANTPAPVTAPAPVTTAAFPAAYAPFRALIGSQNGDTAAWNGSACSLLTDNSQLPSALDAVTCKTTGGVTFTVIRFPSAAPVQQIVAKAKAGGANVRGWTKSTAQSGTTVEVTSADGAELVTTFLSMPNMVVDMNNSGSIPNLEASWVQMPLPA